MSAFEFIKIAQFESDLLKTNKDTAPQSREISRTFYAHSVAAQTCPPPPPPPTIQTSVTFRNFAELYLRRLEAHHFQTS